MEEIRGVTWDYGDAPPLMFFQCAQYLYKAGTTKDGKTVFPFRDAKVLIEGCATMLGESGGYPRAWHANVLRETDGSITRNALGQLTVKSIDLGWIQRNADVADSAMNDADVKPFVEALFDSEQYGYLDRPALAAAEAATLYVARGWQPWYAHANYRRHLPKAGLAVANFLAVEYGLGQSYYMIRPR